MSNYFLGRLDSKIGDKFALGSYTVLLLANIGMKKILSSLSFLIIESMPDGSQRLSTLPTGS